MILYSIIPPDVVFSKSETSNKSLTMEIDYLGERVEVHPLVNNKYRINRVISTSPNIYLDERFAPGQIIESIF